MVNFPEKTADVGGKLGLFGFGSLAADEMAIERYGIAYEHAHSFPVRERVAQATEAELFAVGFSNRKAEYVIGLARSELDLDELAALPDEEVTARLVSLRGLGEWTADWFLARHLARPHAWPEATWDCERPSPRSMVTSPTCEPSGSASIPTRTSAPTTF